MERRWWSEAEGLGLAATKPQRLSCRCISLSHSRTYQSKSESSSLSDRRGGPPCRIVRCCCSAACCLGAGSASSKMAPTAASRAASTSAGRLAAEGSAAGVRRGSRANLKAHAVSTRPHTAMPIPIRRGTQLRGTQHGYTGATAAAHQSPSDRNATAAAHEQLRLLHPASQAAANPPVAKSSPPSSSSPTM